MNSRMFPILVVVCIITHIIRTVYEVLKHKKIIIPGRLSFAIIFTNMVLLWTSWFLLCASDSSYFHLPPAAKYYGIAIVAVGLILFLTALSTIKSLETYNGNLITHGIYSLIRHPMYLGFILWLIGLPTVYGTIYSFALSLPFILNVLYWRHLEEHELLNRFSEYREYRKKTIF